MPLTLDTNNSVYKNSVDKIIVYAHAQNVRENLTPFHQQQIVEGISKAIYLSEKEGSNSFADKAFKNYSPILDKNIPSAVDNVGNRNRLIEEMLRVRNLSSHPHSPMNQSQDSILKNLILMGSIQQDGSPAGGYIYQLSPVRR